MPRYRQYSDEAILIGLQVMAHDRAREMGANRPVWVPMSYWDAHRDKKVHAPASTVAARFGSWSNACHTAGIPIRVPSRLAAEMRALGTEETR